MALITCPECRKKISDNAVNCPNCGYQLTPEKLSKIKKKEDKAGMYGGIGCLVAIVILVILLMIGSFSSDSEKSSGPKTKEEIRKEQIEKHFSPWDGSHDGLTALIKESMNDPGSYEHVKTFCIDRGDYLLVTATFRGKNVFGGVIRNWVQAKVDLNGNIIEVIAQGSVD